MICLFIRFPEKFSSHSRIRDSKKVVPKTKGWINPHEKKVLGLICLVLLIAFSFLASSACAATYYTDEYSSSFSYTAEFEDKLSILEEAFPPDEVWYWNTWSQSELGSASQKKITINNVSTCVSTKPCPNYKTTVTNRDGKQVTVNVHSYYQCSSKENNIAGWSSVWKCKSVGNSFRSKWGGNYQCWGFANYIFRVLWGNDGYQYTYKKNPNCLDWLEPGDEVRANNHSFIIIDIIKDQDTGEITSYKILDCNWPNKVCQCQIAWRTVSRKTVSGWWGKYKNGLDDYVVLHKEHTGGSSTGLVELNRSTDPVSDHEYILYKGKISWDAANQFAQELGEGYQLATMNGDSSQEQSIIESLVDRFGKACWLGGNNVDGSWKWVTGETISPDDTRWNEGEPSGGTEHYLGIYGDSAQTIHAVKNAWNDFKLTNNTISGFVIEYTPPQSQVSWTPEYYENALYVAVTQKTVRAEPYESAEVLLTFSENNPTLQTSGVYRNQYNHLWLKVESVWNHGSSNDQTVIEGYVYAGNCQYSGNLGTATCEGTLLPSDTIRLGASCPIDATLYSSDSIRTVIARIYRYPADPDDHTEDWTLVQEWTYELSGTTTTSLDLNAAGINSVINTAALGTGSYRMFIDVVPVHDERVIGIDAYDQRFDVVETGVSEISFTRPAGSFAERLAVLQDTFPQGWYWNKWDDANLGTNTQRKITIGSNKTAVSTKPGSGDTTLTYWGNWHGSGECGFARMLFDLTWNMDTEGDCYCYYYSLENEDGYIVNYLSPGDMVYTKCGGVNRYYYITGISGDVITYASCNRNGNYDISWNNVITRQALLAELDGSASAGIQAYVCSPAPKYFASTEFEWACYKVTASSYDFKRTANSDSNVFAIGFTLSRDELFYAGMNHLYTDSHNVQWAYCKNLNGDIGWIQINNTDYCVPYTPDQQEVSLLNWDEGVSVFFPRPDDEVFHIGDTVYLTLRDDAVTNIQWASSDPSVVALEADPDSHYCTATVLSSGAFTVTVAGITSPVFTVPERYTTTIEGNVCSFEPDLRTADDDDWTLFSIDSPSFMAYIPATVDGRKVASISKGVRSEDFTLSDLSFGQGIKRIYSEAFSYNLMALESVYIPASVGRIDSFAFAFDYSVFVDFYFDGMDTLLENNAVFIDTYKVPEEDYRITFHCKAGSAAEAYALQNGFDIVYTDTVSLSFGVTDIWMYSGVPFSMPESAPVTVSPASLQYKIDPVYSSSDDCVLVYDGGLLFPNGPGTATVTAQYGNARATVTVHVLGKNSCLVLPGSTRTIEENAFSGDRAVRAVVLPDNIRRIEAKAFANCTNLRAVWLPSLLEYIAPDAFDGCPNIVLYMHTDHPGIGESYAQYYDYPYEYCDP